MSEQDQETVAVERGRLGRLLAVVLAAKAADRAERDASLEFNQTMRAIKGIIAHGKRIDMGVLLDGLEDGDLDPL